MISILLVLLIGGGFVGLAVWSAFRVKECSGWKRWALTAGFGLIAIGGVGFFGCALSGVGGLRWLSPSFEWPVGFAHDILEMPDGTRVVPHQPSNRIQVYDGSWRFLRGWHVAASGGKFTLGLTGTNQMEVITARGRMRLVYALDGSLISQEKYPSQSYYDYRGSGVSAVVPTRWWLWMFTSPLYSWMVFMLGMVLLFFADRKRAKR